MRTGLDFKSAQFDQVQMSEFEDLKSYRIVKIYFKTLASSTQVGFHEGRRQFIYKVFIFTRE